MEQVNKPYIVGIDLGGTNVRAAVTDRSGKIIGEGREPSLAMDGLDITVGQIIRSVRAALDQAQIDTSLVAGAGMGVPGHLDSKKGIVYWSPNFKDWNGVQLLAPLREEFGFPFFMGNDANVAALGEFGFGAGGDVDSLVMITLGTGIGGGIVLNGKLWVGANDAGGELGHTIILADGPECSCGRHGCIESLARRDAIIERAAKKVQQGRQTVLATGEDWLTWSVTPATIAKAAQDGDQVAIETMAETGYYLGVGLSNFINTLAPEMIVIGGGISQAGDVLWGPMLRTVNALALKQGRDFCKIVPAELGDDAGIMGGVTMVLQEVG